MHVFLLEILRACHTCQSAFECHLDRVMQKIASDGIETGVDGKPASNVILDRQTEVTPARSITDLAFCLKPIRPVLTVLLATRFKNLIRRRAIRSCEVGIS